MDKLNEDRSLTFKKAAENQLKSSSTNLLEKIPVDVQLRAANQGAAVPYEDGTSTILQLHAMHQSSEGGQKTIHLKGSNPDELKLVSPSENGRVLTHAKFSTPHGSNLVI